MTAEGNLRQLQLQVMPVRNCQNPENTGACGRVKRQHMDHIAEKDHVGSFHYGLVHMPASIQEAMKIPEAKSAVDKEWDKLQTIPAWDVNKVRPKSEVICPEEGWKNGLLRKRRTCKSPPEV